MKFTNDEDPSGGYEEGPPEEQREGVVSEQPNLTPRRQRASPTQQHARDQRAMSATDQQRRRAMRGCDLQAAYSSAALRTCEREWAPAWARAAHPTHSLITCGGVFACTACALQASSPRPRLLESCRNWFPKGSDRDLKALRKAKLPRSLSQWPTPNLAGATYKLPQR